MKNYVKKRYDEFREYVGYDNWIEKYFDVISNIDFEFNLYYSPEHEILSIEGNARR